MEVIEYACVIGHSIVCLWRGMVGYERCSHLLLYVDQTQGEVNISSLAIIFNSNAHTCFLFSS